MTERAGVVVAAGADGRRSTTAAGRAVLAAALRPVDPDGARAVEGAEDWRKDYPAHFRRLVEAGLRSPEDWVHLAGAGLDELDHRMRIGLTGGDEAPLTAALAEPATRKPGTEEVRGSGEREAELVLPYRGELLRGDGIRRRVESWIAGGIAEPSLAGPIDAVLAHPEWLRLDGVTVAALGAGAEMAPVAPLLRWGATVAAVDLPRPALQDRLRAAAAGSAGRLLLPTDGDAAGTGGRTGGQTGADLLTEVPAIADWLTGLPGRLVLGTYAYADGSLHLRLSAAADVLGRRVRQQRADLALAYLATPTDVFAVPGAAVTAATTAYERSAARRLGAVTPLFHRPYEPGTDPGINDSLIPQQGPNYALAKRVQRWRATVARAAGATVSFHVAPSTRTRSVVSRRTLKAAFTGAHHFGVEVFEPATSSTLLAALLVHDLNTTPPVHAHPWQDEAYTAVHGGLWRTTYAPRSVFPLAALLGLRPR
ncbi:MAG TPA: hypothetical protein VGP36_16045 [Mycobacteriales bacterium]|jgi:hypothetical protein|nr:hypothetical protein [Mycobacteriales bacterium]